MYPLKRESVNYHQLLIFKQTCLSDCKLQKQKYIKFLDLKLIAMLDSALEFYGTIYAQIISIVKWRKTTRHVVLYIDGLLLLK